MEEVGKLAQRNLKREEAERGLGRAYERDRGHMDSIVTDYRMRISILEEKRMGKIREVIEMLMESHGEMRGEVEEMGEAGRKEGEEGENME